MGDLAAARRRPDLTLNGDWTEQFDNGGPTLRGGRIAKFRQCVDDHCGEAGGEHSSRSVRRVSHRPVEQVDARLEGDGGSTDSVLRCDDQVTAIRQSHIPVRQTVQSRWRPVQAHACDDFAHQMVEELRHRWNVSVLRCRRAELRIGSRCSW
ncbi:hypothetical protein GCM10020218_086120 [Dactylosporangium vinaceum]